MFHAFLSSAALPVFLAWVPGPFEWMVIAGLGLLIFGKRLPEVGRSLGKGIVEFKKGIKGVEEDAEEAANRPTPTPAANPQHKFDPYTGKPLLPKFDPETGKPLDQAAEVEQHKA
jgi:sec-independent protein translocase protein TatA